MALSKEYKKVLAVYRMVGHDGVIKILANRKNAKTTTLDLTKNMHKAFVAFAARESSSVYSFYNMFNNIKYSDKQKAEITDIFVKVQTRKEYATPIISRNVFLDKVRIEISNEFIPIKHWKLIAHSPAKIIARCTKGNKIINFSIKSGKLVKRTNG